MLGPMGIYMGTGHIINLNLLNMGFRAWACRPLDGLDYGDDDDEIAYFSVRWKTRKLV